MDTNGLWAQGFIRIRIHLQENTARCQRTPSQVRHLSRAEPVNYGQLGILLSDKRGRWEAGCLVGQVGENPLPPWSALTASSVLM